jgi:hypothetical protein
MSYGPGLSISNGSGCAQTLQPRSFRQVTMGSFQIVGPYARAGFMWYHLSDLPATQHDCHTQNATSQGATAKHHGLRAGLPARTPDNISLCETPVEDMTNSDAAYFRDQWRLAEIRRLPPDPVRLRSAPPQDLLRRLEHGIFNVSQPVAPLFPQATVPYTYFYPQRNGWEPRLGLAYQVTSKTVFRSAFAIIDDHNQAWGQEAQNAKKSWPEASQATINLLNRGVPDTFMTNLPSLNQFLNPNQPVLSQTADPHQKISYTMEWNAGIQQQLTNTMVVTVNYVGSAGRQQYLQWNEYRQDSRSRRLVCQRPALALVPRNINMGFGSWNCLLSRAPGRAEENHVAWFDIHGRVYLFEISGRTIRSLWRNGHSRRLQLEEQLWAVGLRHSTPVCF